MYNSLILPKLYKVDNTQVTVVWSIEADVDLKKVHIRWKKGTGQEQFYSADAEDPIKEAERRHRIQLERKGFSVVPPSKVPNLPMLAQVWKEEHKPFERTAIQPKLDGHRCIASRECLVSRRKERIVSVPHIHNILKHLPEGVSLDGELYVHGVPLQTIASYVRRDTPHHLYKQIEYHVFDIAVDNTPFEERFVALEEIIRDLEDQFDKFTQELLEIPASLRGADFYAFPIKLVETKIIDEPSNLPTTQAWIKKELREAKKAGFEGLMIRNPDSYYEFNKRSSNLLKYKEFLDDEFEIVDVQEVTGTQGQFVCKTPEGRIFEVTPAWTHSAKRKLLTNKEYYIGRFLHVRFEKYSRDGIPIPPVGHLTYATKEERAG
jgi:DNA ligase-1